MAIRDQAMFDGIVAEIVDVGGVIVFIADDVVVERCLPNTVSPEARMAILAYKVF